MNLAPFEPPYNMLSNPNTYKAGGKCIVQKEDGTTVMFGLRVDSEHMLILDAKWYSDDIKYMSPLSQLSEMIVGKKVDEILALTDADIASFCSDDGPTKNDILSLIKNAATDFNPHPQEDA